MNDLMDSIQKGIDDLAVNLKIGETFISSGDERWKENNPIQHSMLKKIIRSRNFW